MGSLNGRLDRLEGRIGIPKTEAQREQEREQERRKQRVIAELTALEAHIKRMSKAERDAWRNSPQQLTLRAEFEEHERRRRGEA